MMADSRFRLMVANGRRVPIVQPDDTELGLSLKTGLQCLLVAEAEQLSVPLHALRRAWQPVAGDADWGQVAPSLVVGWLLGHVGALQLLAILDLEAAAVDLSMAELEQMVVLSFLRVSPESGVAHLLGGPYATGWQVRQMLEMKAVQATLASADAEGELLIAGGSEEPLRQLHAYVEEERKAFYPGKFRLALPVLSAGSLRLVGEELSGVSSQLHASWSRLVDGARGLLADQEMTLGQWLRFYSYCVGEMTNVWLQEQLLPLVVPFEPNQRVGLFRRRNPQSQQPPCGLCFWRDVDRLWELGKELVK